MRLFRWGLKVRWAGLEWNDRLREWNVRGVEGVFKARQEEVRRDRGRAIRKGRYYSLNSLWWMSVMILLWPPVPGSAKECTSKWLPGNSKSKTGGRKKV